MRKLYKLLLVLVAFSVALSACAGGTGGKTSGEPKVATLLFTQEPDTMNPQYTNMYFSTILHPLWNVWAWQFDDQNAAYPVLVKEMPSTSNGGISADGKVLTLHLRDDIVWSDGQAVTSADFKFTFDMTMEPKNTLIATTYPYDSIASIDTPDKTTVVVNFAEPFAPWLLLFHGLLFIYHNKSYILNVIPAKAGIQSVLSETLRQ